MPINILMPALSPTMTEGNLARWLKKEGDAVKPGDVIAEIETDKATMEVEAVEEGKIGKILVPDGAQGVKVNDVIAVLLEEGESTGDIKASAAPAPKAAAAPAPKAEAAPAKAEAPKPAAAPATAPTPAPRAAPAPAAASGARVFASPLAKRLAQQHGLDLSRIVGTGPHGRVVKSDVDKAAAGGGAKAAPAPAAAKGLPSAPSVPGTPAFGEPEFDLTPHSMMRKTIARRLQELKQFVPHFYLTVDCEIDRLLKAREEINAGAPKEGKGAFKLSVNDFVIKACAIALKQVPAANASWSDEGVKMYKTSDISVAVAIPNGLITPIIRQAEDKRLSEISGEMKGLAGARQGRQAEAGGLHRRQLLAFQPRHVRHQGFRRHHQSAAGLHPGGRRRRAARGGEERAIGGGDGDELHLVGRPPGGGRRDRRGVHERAQEADRESAVDAGVRVDARCLGLWLDGGLRHTRFG